MKTIARILTRLQGEGDGLFIGALFKDGIGLLDPNSIYDIREVLGVLTIVKAGEAVGTNAGPSGIIRNYDDGNLFHWASEISHVIAQGSEIFLTREELLAHRAELMEARNG